MKPGESRRKGSIFFLVAFVFLTVSILAFQFLQVSRHRQFANFKLEQDLAAEAIAEAVSAEAHAHLSAAAAAHESPFKKWLISGDATEFSVSLPLMQKYVSATVEGNVSPTIECRARKIDFRHQNNRGIPYAAPAEGVGVLALEAKVELHTGSVFRRSRVGSARLVVHHDYLVVSMVSPRKNDGQRDRYSHCFPLDYALLVRDGMGEFRRHGGHLLNNRDRRFKITQGGLFPDQRGKIYFGGADGTPGSLLSGSLPPQANQVFFNLSEDFHPFIPSFSQTIVIDQDEVLQLLPDLSSRFPNIPANASWQGLKGVFETTTAPIVRPGYPGEPGRFEQETRDYLLSTCSGSESSGEPCFELPGPLSEIADEGYLETICEGSIKKRFCYLVSFFIDASSAVAEFPDPNTGTVTQRPISAIEAETLKQWEHRIPCLPKAPGTSAPPPEPLFQAVLNQSFAERGGIPLISTFLASHSLTIRSGDLFSPGNDFPQPRFFNTEHQPIEVHQTGPGGFRPYNHFELWTRRKLKWEDLEPLGILDPANKIIHMHGIIHLADKMVLNDDWLIRGQGVLIADSFVISGGLKKESEQDFIVLFTRKGDIQIQTSKPIEAVLMAVNDSMSGAIQATVGMNLKGALIADCLNFHQWAAGDHKLEYDKVLKRPDGFTYQAHLSKWTNFRVCTRD